MQNNNLPLSFVFKHKDMLSAMGKVGLKSLKLIHPQKHDSWQEIPEIKKTISAPSNDLVDAYIEWSGAPLSRYDKTLPPHMFSQWGLALGTELALQTSLNLVNVINQGVSMNIYGELPRNEKLQLSAKIDSFQEQDGVARLIVKMTTGTIQNPKLVEAFIHMAFLLPSFKKSKQNKDQPELDWKTQGQWYATQHDGFKFALLTGDFNPIHWISLAGKLSAFKMKVLHGFGMFVRSYEQLPLPITSIDVRFLKPVKLPSADLNVEIHADQSDKTQFRLRSKEGVIHLFGTYQSIGLMTN